jgi:hypothetical protein
MDMIHLLKVGDTTTRIYGKLLGGIKAEIADYQLYTDFRGLEWLHVHVKKDNMYILLPFLRLETGEEYLEYLKHV